MAENEASQPKGFNIKRTSSLHKMLTSIQAERKRDTEALNDDGCIVLNLRDAFWTTIFTKHFLKSQQSGSEGSCDDLLFFVRKPSTNGRSGSSNNLASEDAVQVFRKDSKTLPSLGDPSFDWEETVYLNLILHQFEYTLTCAVCTRTGDRELQILKKCSQKVYASPSQRRMDTKGSEETITYPDIFFTVDNFDEAFTDIVVRDSEMVCVELVATDKMGEFQSVIFLGSIRYEALKTVFDNKASVSARMKQSLTWGHQRINDKRTEFIRMRGPCGKGYAEMAISRMAGVPDTPSHTPLITPASTPGASPVHEEYPTFPAVDPQNEQNSYTADSRRYSDVTVRSPFKNGFKWAFGLKKSQSASDHVTAAYPSQAEGEVEAKSISEELHHSGSGVLGRSFGQAWHWFKEQRRAASVGLNACLTYVTLPWHRIIADILDHNRTPVLSF